MLISPVLMTTAVNRRLIDCMKLSATALSHHHHSNRSPAAPSARDPPMCHKSAIPPGASILRCASCRPACKSSIMNVPRIGRDTEPALPILKNPPFVASTQSHAEHPSPNSPLSSGNSNSPIAGIRQEEIGGLLGERRRQMRARMHLLLQRRGSSMPQGLSRTEREPFQEWLRHHRSGYSGESRRGKQTHSETRPRSALHDRGRMVPGRPTARPWAQMP